MSFLVAGRKNYLLLVMAGCTALAGAYGIAWNPSVAAAIAAAALLLLATSVAGGLGKLFLASLFALLTGYVFFGRGFSYLGVAPLFVGEMVLGLGLLSLASNQRTASIFRSPLVWLLLAFGLYQAVCTVPYVPAYGLNALRDAVLWGYGVFALLVGAWFAWPERVERLPALYSRWFPWFLWWLPVAALLQSAAAGLIPAIGGVPLLSTKSGDTAVHLSGVLGFLFLNLHKADSTTSKNGAWREWLWWVAWLMGVVLHASINRGGLLAVILAGAVLFAFRPLGNWRKAVVLIALVALLTPFAGLQVESRYTGRLISPQQIVSNVESIFSPKQTADGGLEGTREFRLTWWKKIIDYTVFGPHFWQGKGYGINLADADGFQVTADGSLRSPHNVHMTFLARSGVPGLLLWLLLQAAFGFSLLRAHLQARRSRQERWAQLTLWILVYWLAFLVNATFDVYLEGPPGGIWFWSVFGYGIALIELVRHGYCGSSGPPSPQ